MKKALILLLFALTTFGSYGQIGSDTLTPQKKAVRGYLNMYRKKVTLLPDNTFTNAFRAVTNLAAIKVPYLTMDQVRAGMADTARVVQVIDAGKEGVFKYNSGNTTSLDDSVSFIRFGTRRYERQMEIANTNWLTNSTEASFFKMVAALGSAKKTILLSGTVPITSNRTIPDNIKINFQPGATFNISSGVTLTINSAITEGDQQLFTGSGIVNGKFRAVNVRWFGAKGDGTTDDTQSIQKAIDIINSLGGGDLRLHDAYKVSTLVLKKKVKIVGTGTLIGTPNTPILQIFGSSNTDWWNFSISGISMQYPTLVVGNAAADAIQIKYVSGGDITDVKFENCNIAVNFVPVGVFQHSKQISIRQSRFTNNNYEVVAAGTPDDVGTVGGDFVAKLFELGDITITDNYFYLATYSHILMQGVDGLNLSRNWYFHKYNSTTKLYNVDLYNVTRVYVENEHIFEPGLDAIRIGRFRHVTISNLEIAWPGQVVPANGIKLYGKAGNTTLSNTQTKISNVQISKPTKHGIEIGPYLNGIELTNIQCSDIGVADQYLGTPTDVTSIAHNSVYSDATSSGITYSGAIESYNDYGVSLNGAVSAAKETNITHGSVIEMPNVAKSSNNYANLSFTENLVIHSNDFSFANWTKSGTTVEEQTGTISPLGYGSVWKVVESSGTSAKAILSSPITKVLTEEDFTLSFYAKAASRKHLSVTLTNNSFTGGVIIDFNIEKGKMLWVTPDANYVLNYAKIEKAAAGYFKIEISVKSLAASTDFRYGIYSNYADHKGAASLAGDGVTNYLLAHNQVVRSAGTSQYIETFLTTAPRTSNTVYFSGNLAPTETNLSDLGSSTKSFKNAYIAGTTYLGGVRGYSAGVSFVTNSGVTGMFLNSSGNVMIQNGGSFVNSAEQLQVIGATKLDGSVTSTGHVKAATFESTAIPTYEDNAAATTGGLAVGRFYKTSTGDVRVRY